MISRECHKNERCANAGDRGRIKMRPRVLKSQPVSRVLSGIIIHLDWKSPSSLKQPTRKRRGPRHSFPIWSCSGWGLPCRLSYQKRGALLPHHFTLTRRRLRFVLAVSFLLHWPWALAPQTLSGTLSCGARTFLQFDISCERQTSDYPADCARFYPMHGFGVD